MTLKSSLLTMTAVVTLALAGCNQAPKKEQPQPAPNGGKPETGTKPEAGGAMPQTQPAAPAAHEPLVDESARRESVTSIMRGAAYLVAEQQENGSWSDHPGITAMCVVALAESPQAKEEDQVKAIDRALSYLRGRITEDGKIQQATAETDIYSASVCLMALRTLNRPEDQERIGKVRRFLIASQVKGKSEFDYGGGLGYKSYPDLSNTHWALEAIRLTRTDAEDEVAKKLWPRSATFITTCQITAADAGAARGGFRYYPIGREPEKPAHAKTEVVWGSLTMGALKTLIFADVKTDDARIKLGLDWIGSNYTLEKNPGLDQGGLYYYYYMFSSGMTFLRQDYVQTAADVRHNWRQELVDILLSRQRGDGQWTNENKLWLESNPPLCTAYAVKALQFALRAP